MKRRPSSGSLSLNNFLSPSASTSSRYVCFQCRHRASLQRQPLLPVLSHAPAHSRSYANRPAVIDKFNKGMENFIVRTMFKEDPRLPEPDKTKPPSEQEPPEVTDIGEGPVAPPRAPMDDPDYKPATSGEGLEMIGGPTGWWEKAWDEQFQFKGFMPSTPNRDSAAVRRAIEQALGEALGQEASLSVYPAICDTYGAMRTSGDMNQYVLWGTDKDIILESRSNKYGIIFSPDLKEMKIFERPREEVVVEETDPAEEETNRDSISSWTEFDEPGSRDDPSTASQNDAEDEQTDLSSPVADPVETVPLDPKFMKIRGRLLSTVHHLDSRKDSFPSPMEDVEPVIEEIEEDLEEELSNPEEDVEPVTEETGNVPVLVGNITIRDPEFKFKIFKRVMELTGNRIPDPVIQSINSSDALYNRLIAQPPPKKLAQMLIEGRKRKQNVTGNMEQEQRFPLLSSLPNVKIHSSKRVPEMAEGALGRQKIIERELGRYGIPVPFKDVVEQITASEKERLRQNRTFLDQEEQEEEIDVNALEEPDAEIRWPEEEVREQRAQ
ncbi:MAG: hypothetical protein Q9212_005098 [Teloschistes hypoglaucus]